jgi:hypothetical protein
MSRENFTPYPNNGSESVGIQSHIEIGTYIGKPAIKKTAGGSLPRETNEMLLSAIPTYAKSMREAGFSLPTNYELYMSTYGLVMIDEFVGPTNIDQMIRTGHPMLQPSWRRVVEHICDISDSRHKSAVFVDAKPANFVLDEDSGTVYYVDFFPPMLRDENGRITPWVDEIYKRHPELMRFNFGDTRGQLTKLLAGVRISHPDMYPMLARLTRQTIDGKLDGETHRYVVDQMDSVFPDMTLFYSGAGMLDRLNELQI